jgi:hypothetical protein
MSAALCGPVDLDKLAAAETEIYQSLAASGGLPYPLTVKTGVILKPKDLPSELSPALTNLFTTYANEFGQELMTPHNSEIDSPLQVYGIARRRPGMTTATTVAAIADAIFGEPAAPGVADAIRKGLAARQAILMALYDRKGTVPDDVYDEGAVLLKAHGVQVYFPGGPY